MTSDSQRDVKVLDWRPNGGKSLSVGCKQVSFLPRVNLSFYAFFINYKAYLTQFVDWISGVEFASGLLRIQEMQHLLDLVLLHSWEPSLEALVLDGL